jgi:hypothetical protein
MIFRLYISLGCLVPLFLWGDASQNYTLDCHAMNEGSVLGASENYTADISSMHGGTFQSLNYSDRIGYAGQLADVVALNVFAGPDLLILNEGEARQFLVVLTYDDTSLAAAATERLTWNSGDSQKLVIDDKGFATAVAVYQDTEVMISVTCYGFSKVLSLTVVNSGGDNFGAYAADGLPDTWQVEYFGESGSQGGPTVDSDSDGLNNLQEYAFGMNPSQGSAAAVAWSGSTLLNAGAPIAFASGTASTFTFRAVFARRVDYLAAHLAYTVEFSADLSTWKASTSKPTVLAADSQVQAVSVPYPFFVDGKKAKFFRVKVQSLQ